MNRIIKYGLALPIILGSINFGCIGSPTLIKKGYFRDFEAKITKYANGYRTISLDDISNDGSISAKDYSSTKDWFHEVEMHMINKGDRLENYLNSDSLELAYKTVLEQNE